VRREGQSSFVALYWRDCANAGRTQSKFFDFDDNLRAMIILWQIPVSMEGGLSMLFTRNGAKLAEVIKKAIDDHLITATEYEEIVQLAHQDGVNDSHEQVLLKEFNTMIADGSIKRVP
jgi:hypothetical protein